jgi:23S rRNA pseudouridine2605 synthase
MNDFNEKPNREGSQPLYRANAQGQGSSERRPRKKIIRDKYTHEIKDTRSSVARSYSSDNYRSSYQQNRGYEGQNSYDNDGYNNSYGGGYNRPFSDRPQERPSFRNRMDDNMGYDRRSNNGGFNRGNSYGDRPTNQRPRINSRQSNAGYQRQGAYGDRPNNNRFGNNNRGGNFRGNGNNNARPNNRFNNNRSNFVERGRKYEEVSVPVRPEADTIRLNKFLANAGVCSRREADNYIQAGVVSVNGVIVTELGTKVNKDDKVLFHDQRVQTEHKVYILLNKPKNCVTTSDDPQERLTVMDLVKNACSERVYPVGRLDKNTTGVLLLTNDGDLASRLTHPKHDKKKIYHAFLDRPVDKKDMTAISEGIELEDGVIKADAVSYPDLEDKKQVGIEIHSGKNRIVRRIFEHLGYRVVKLDRVYFAGLTKKNLPRGKWRFLTAAEITSLIMGAYE